MLLVNSYPCTSPATFYCDWHYLLMTCRFMHHTTVNRYTSSLILLVIFTSLLLFGNKDIYMYMWFSHCFKKEQSTSMIWDKYVLPGLQRRRKGQSVERPDTHGKNYQKTEVSGQTSEWKPWNWHIKCDALSRFTVTRGNHATLPRDHACQSL